MKRNRFNKTPIDNLYLEDKLLAYLEIANYNENQLRNSVRNTLKFYTTTLLSVMGGTFFISKDIDEITIKAAIFFIGGILVSALSIIGFIHYKSDYRRQVEQIVVQAKVEDQLDFTSTYKYRGKNYWEKESLVPNIYIKTRKSHELSDGFINCFLKGTDMKLMKYFFTLFSICGVTLFFLGFYFLVPVIAQVIQVK